MIYNKPEIINVVRSVAAVQSQNLKQQQFVQDSAYPVITTPQTSAAYEADE
jgi:hypothetical protein